MMFSKVFYIASVLSAALAIDCTAKELKSYNFESIKGIHSLTFLKDTPPSQTNSTWYFGICESIDDGVEKCPRNSDICGITSIILDKQDSSKTVVSEIVGFNSNLQKTYEPFANDSGKGIVIKYKAANWGDNLVDAEIKFVCPTKDDDDLDKFVLDKWDGDLLQVSVKSKAACITSEKDKDKQNKDGDKNKDDKGSHSDDGESWGWFTWIFIFLVLFLSFYIIGGAWYQYNKGISIDFQTALVEVLQNFVELLKGLPAFFKEIVEKVTGNGNRGEYSAV